METRGRFRDFTWGVRFARSLAFLLLAAAAVTPAAAQDCAPDTLLATLNNLTPAVDDQFGYSVSVDGSLIAVGAPYDDGGGATDSGRAYVKYGVSTFTITNPSPATDDHFGWSVAISGNRAIVGAPLDDAGMTDAGRAYVYDATNGSLVRTFSSPALAVGINFGVSVAISGELAVIGAWNADDAGAADSGKAYVFNARTGGLVATLSNPAPAASDSFGISVAISGNLAVVGAYRDDAGASNSGTAYVFNATTGALVATLSNPSPAASDVFGWSVAISGNLAVVGTYSDNTGATNAGRAYVFNATTGALTATLANPNPTDNDQFGRSVAISGNLAVVGTALDDAGAADAGTTYVFNATTGVLEATLANPAPAAGDGFGFSVAISGNLVVAGAYFDDAGASGSGTVYSFTCGVPCVPDTRLHTFVSDEPSLYGSSVAISGDVGLVGAPLDSTEDTNSGAVYFLNTATGTTTAKFASYPFTLTYFENLGQSVAISGNLAVAGVPGFDSTATDQGRAIVFYAAPPGLKGQLSNPASQDNDQFGFSVGISGNLAVVGEPQHDGTEVNQGEAYVFNATTNARLATLITPDPFGDGQFGSSVAIAGNLAVVGQLYAHAEEIGPEDGAGRAFVFNATTGALVATLLNPAPQTFDHFSSSLAISGNLAIVGAKYKDIDVLTNDVGAAYVFDATTGALVTTLVNPTPAKNDEFGGSVSIHGNLAIVGATGKSVGGTGTAGSAYVFNATTGVRLATLTDPDLDAQDAFGRSVAIDGNLVMVGVSGGEVTGNGNEGVAYCFTCASLVPTPTPTPTVTPSPTVTPTPTASPTASPTPTPTPLDNSAFTTNNMPANIPASHGVPFRVTVSNIGNTTWTPESGYALAVVTDPCTLSGSNRLSLPAGTVVAPGSSQQFETILNVPAATGPCNFELQMVQDGGVGLFGPTLVLAPVVVAAVNNAVAVSSTIPAALAPDQGVWVGVTMRNTGNTPWYGGSNYALAVIGSPCMIPNAVRYYLDSGDIVMPNQSNQFLVYVTAPATPGPCNIQFQMIEEPSAFFGQVLSRDVNVAVPTNTVRDWNVYE